MSPAPVIVVAAARSPVWLQSSSQPTESAELRRLWTARSPATAPGSLSRRELGRAGAPQSVRSRTV
jgi:hypothetical protein